MKLELIDSGVVYRNPKPHLRSVHAWHPTIARLGDGTLLAAFDLGEAIESLDYRTYTSRSHDGGHTWDTPKRLFEDNHPRRAIHTVRIRRLKDGSLIGFGARAYRDDPEEGLTNRANLGYVPMDLILLRSSDEGASWQGPQVIEPPLVGPSFEVCHPIMELADGRWLAPTATWKGWDGSAPNGMKAIALVSHDRGKTWPEWIDVVDQWASGIVSWELGMCELPGGRLLGVVWCLDDKAGRSLPNKFALSRDGRTFGPPRANGLRGETAKLLTHSTGNVVCLYRRLDQPGLWANLVRIEGDNWNNVAETAVWQGPSSGMKGEGKAADELSSLKFGFPTMIELPDGDVFAVFWCLDNCLYSIRWAKLRIAA